MDKPHIDCWLRHIHYIYILVVLRMKFFQNLVTHQMDIAFIHGSLQRCLKFHCHLHKLEQVHIQSYQCWRADLPDKPHIHCWLRQIRYIYILVIRMKFC